MSEKNPLHNPNDRFFKHAFGRADAAAGFFKEYLPPELANRLNWERLERQEGTFVDETLSERHSDLLFAVPWAGRNVFPYCRFEPFDVQRAARDAQQAKLTGFRCPRTVGELARLILTNRFGYHILPM